MLIIFGGLPGSGKSTISSRLAEQLSAIYLRIDSIETAIKNSSLKPKEENEAGYLIAYEIAKDNLLLGHTVIADSVNPIEASRNSWKNVAIEQNKKFLEIEIICSNKEEHKNRIMKRNGNIYDNTPLTKLESITQHIYEPWNNIDLQLDTFNTSVENSVTTILEKINSSDENS